MGSFRVLVLLCLLFSYSTQDLSAVTIRSGRKAERVEPRQRRPRSRSIGVQVSPEDLPVGDCAISMEQIEQGKGCSLGCHDSHRAHHACIGRFLTINRVAATNDAGIPICPSCRTPIAFFNGALGYRIAGSIMQAGENLVGLADRAFDHVDRDREFRAFVVRHQAALKILAVLGCVAFSLDTIRNVARFVSWTASWF